MILSDEQKEVVEYDGKNLIVNACAGSGKSSTLLQYLKTRPDKKKLFLCFNSSVSKEITLKAKLLGIENIQVSTAHSLAYRAFPNMKKYTLAKALKPFDLMQVFGVKPNLNNLTLYKNATDLFNMFCNSDKMKIKEIDYLAAISMMDIYGDTEKKQERTSVVKKQSDAIYKIAQKIWDGMKSGELSITHDFYLKHYHLTKPKVNAEIVVFDEMQDASPQMLDLFQIQEHCNKIGIGDSSQAIYGWRGAIDALNVLDYPKKNLSKSFRFAQNIADIANEIIQCKTFMDPNFKYVPMAGMDKPHIENNHTCYLARNNLRLLSKLIEFVGSGGTEFAFEGSIDQSIYTQDGVSIYDIYALFAGKRDYMRSDFIKAFGSWKEFLQYIDLMEDFELKILAGLVVKYRGEIFSLLKKIKATEKSKKDSRLIFSSAHKSKGLEYGKVYLLDDFLQKEEFESLLRIKSNIPEQSIGKTVSLESVNQELNLLYVAVTRTVNELFLSGEIPLFSSLPPSYSNRASLGKRI
jgi:F-box protein, helicase, 18